MTLLTVTDLTMRFGGIVAVDDLSFTVNKGEVLTLIGPNGAGKSTVFNLISRLYNAHSGSIVFNETDVTKVPAHRIAALGIARTFQNTELFEHATVLQNILAGRHSLRQSTLLQHIFYTAKTRQEELSHRQRAEEIIDFFDLQLHRHSVIAGLPYGVRKVVELARAVASEPSLLLLDEPSAGLSAEETSDVAFWIEDLQKDYAMTILMVEHNMDLIHRVADRIVALDDGAELASGTPREVLQHPDVVAAYLGRTNNSDESVVQ